MDDVVNQQTAREMKRNMVMNACAILLVYIDLVLVEHRRIRYLLCLER